MPLAATSIAAYHSIDLTELEERVLDVIEAGGAEGCISDELRLVLSDLSYSSVTARFASLEEKGKIFRLGDTRPGSSGRQQKVMRVARYKTAASSGVVTPIKKEKRTGFLAGMMFAAKLVVASSDLDSAKRALKSELIKAAKQ